MSRITGDLKDYGRDPAKREVRRKFLEFIERTFPKATYGGTTVLCLPGAELHEYNEVYAHLPGMNEKNLTFVERNKLNAQLIMASLPESSVFPGELLDFVSSTTKRFDIISLDFCSNFTAHVMKIIEVIRRRELMNDHGVLFVAVLAGREGKEAKAHFKQIAEMAFLHESPMDSAYAHLTNSHVKDELAERMLPLARGELVTNAITATIMSGPDTPYIDWLKENGNPALRKRIEEYAFRLHMGLLLKGSLEGAEALKGTIASDSNVALNLKAIQGPVVEKWGINYPMPGYKTTPEIEESVRVLMTSHEPIQYDETDKLIFDFSKKEWHFPAATRKLWGEVFWSLVETNEWTDQNVGGEERIKMASAVATLPKTSYSIYKQVLMEIFKADLTNAALTKTRVVFNGGDAGLAFEYTMGGRAKVYWLNEYERCRYISDSGSPMLVDIASVNRCFQYDKIVAVGRDGYLVPYVPEKILATRKLKRIAQFLDENLADFRKFRKAAMQSCLAVESKYPPRIEIKGDETMLHCETCKRLQREVDLLTRQLREMKKIVMDQQMPRKARKLERRLVGVGPYERRKIAEGIRDNVPFENMARDLKITPGQIGSIKAWITMRGGVENYLKELDDTEAKETA